MGVLPSSALLASFWLVLSLTLTSHLEVEPFLPLLPPQLPEPQVSSEPRFQPLLPVSHGLDSCHQSSGQPVPLASGSPSSVPPPFFVLGHFPKIESDCITPYLETIINSLSSRCDWASHHLQALGLGRSVVESKMTQPGAMKADSGLSS